MIILVYIDGLLIPEHDLVRVEHDVTYDVNKVCVTIDGYDQRQKDTIEALVYSDDGLLKARCLWNPSKRAPENVKSNQTALRDDLEYTLD